MGVIPAGYGVSLSVSFCHFSLFKVVMLHCIQQAKEGGENWLTYGFKVALDLKQTDPQAYDILCNVQMEFKDVSTYQHGRNYLRASHSVIE